jgi:hypothetical protein
MSEFGPPIGIVSYDGNIVFPSESSFRAWQAWKAARRISDALSSQGKFGDPVATGFARMTADEKFRQAAKNPGVWVTPPL